jgi:ribosome assembly protein 1
VCEYAPSPKDRALGGVPCTVDGPTVAYVCKFLFTDPSNIQDSGLDRSQLEKKELIVLGLTRVLGGRLTTGQQYYCCDGSKRAVTIRVYIIMGSSFVKVDSVPAGHLCAVAGLDGVHSKTLTIADSPDTAPIQGVEQHIRPLVKVHIEPELTADAEYLERGLEKLRLADASVEVTATDKGERLLACLGELHLDQCIIDLEKLYCGKEGIKLKISDPIVEFAETTEWFDTELNYDSFFNSRAPQLRQTTIPPYKDEEGIALANHGRFRAVLPSQAAAISLRVVPLTDAVFQAIKGDAISRDDFSEDLNSGLLKLGQALHCHDKTRAADILAVLRDNVCSVDKNGNVLVQYAGLRIGSLVKGVPCGRVYVVKEEKIEGNDGHDGDTTMNDAIPGLEEYRDLQSRILANGIAAVGPKQDDAAYDQQAVSVWRNTLSGSLAAGFGLALRSGPMCEEPIRRTLVILEGVEIALEKAEDGSYHCPKHLIGGMVVSALRVGIRCALLSRPMRLMEAYLRLTLHSSLAGLGPLYQVLGKRRGKVVEDSMVDGTDLLLITAILPQAEAFGLTPELIRVTSGEVTVPEMLFSHWETLNVDPFWVPTSEVEREDFGETQKAGDSSTGIDNTALTYIRNVRKRKGLTVDSVRTVTNAEKQKTLKNK